MAKYDVESFISEKTPLGLEEQNKLVEFIQELQKDYELIFLDKVNVCFKQGEYVQMKEIPDFKNLIKNKGVSKNTIVSWNWQKEMINSLSLFSTYTSEE